MRCFSRIQLAVVLASTTVALYAARSGAVAHLYLLCNTSICNWLQRSTDGDKAPGGERRVCSHAHVRFSLPSMRAGVRGGAADAPGRRSSYLPDGRYGEPAYLCPRCHHRRREAGAKGAARTQTAERRLLPLRPQPRPGRCRAHPWRLPSATTAFERRLWRLKRGRVSAAACNRLTPQTERDDGRRGGQAGDRAVLGRDGHDVR